MSETESRKLRRLPRAALAITVVGLCLSACNGSSGIVTAAPSPVETELAFEVQRQTPVVEIGSATPLAPIGDNAWRPLPAGYLVTTDASGEALLEAEAAAGLCRVYVFRLATLSIRACPKSTYSGGNASCLEELSAAYSECSGHLIMTPSGQAQVVGSWVSVTYLPQSQLTLVIVLEGKVSVWPVLELTDRVLASSSIPLAGGEFLYTMPDDMLRETAGLPGRTPLPLEQLPPLIDALGLEPWMERVRERAGQDGVPTPPPAGGAGSGVVLRGGGGALEDPLVRQAVLSAVRWEEHSRKFFPDPGVPITSELGDEVLDARQVAWDVELAKALLAEAGASDGLSVVLLVSGDDEGLAALADAMAADLKPVGIVAKSQFIGQADAPGRMQALIDAGAAVLWLSRSAAAPPGAARRMPFPGRNGSAAAGGGG